MRERSPAPSSETQRYAEPQTSVAAVVLNWRDAPSTLLCVRSLVSGRQVDHVFVVDNESTGSLRSLREQGVTLIERDANLGFSRGVNVGIRCALEGNFDAVLIINNDAVADDQCVDELVRAWRREGPSAGLLAPVILNPDGTVQSNGGRFRQILAANDDLSSPPSPDYLTWACVLAPRSTLDTVGLLDEAYFMYWEDVDYGLRVRDAGLDLKVVREASVTHEKSKSHTRAGVSIDRYGAHGLVVLARKRRGVLLIIGMPIRLASRVLRRAVSGRFSNARAVIQGALSGWQAGATPPPIPSESRKARS